jgi:hypothetical protein
MSKGPEYTVILIEVIVQSRFLQIVNRDTALNLVNRRHGKLRNGLKPAPTVRQLPRKKRGFQSPRKCHPCA